MKKFIIILLFLLFAISCKESKPNGTVNGLPVPFPSTFAFNKYSPKGVYIVANVDVPESAISAIEAGISGAIRSYRASQPSWTNKLNESDFIVAFIDPHGISQIDLPGAPILKVSGISSAGTVIGVGGQKFSPAIIVLPHQQAQNWQFLKYLKFSTWNEGEHDIEHANSIEVFMTYAVSNDVHPHTPRVYLEGEETE